MATLTAHQHLHPTSIDIPEAIRAKVIELMNQTLASCSDLKSQLKQAHWNVKGKEFYQLHKLFDEIATDVDEYVDMFAERITTLGGTAMGTVRLAAKHSILPEYPYDIFNGMEHVKALVGRMAPFAKHLRQSMDKITEWEDMDTVDLYTEISRGIDKHLWFLEAHLQAE